MSKHINNSKLTDEGSLVSSKSERYTTPAPGSGEMLESLPSSYVISRLEFNEFTSTSHS